MHFLNSVTLFLTVVPIFCELRVRQGWTEQAPIGRGPRQEHSVTAIGTDVYIIGGIPHVFPYPTLDWVEVFSTTSNDWRNASSLPTTINHGNVAAVNGKIYVLGGLNGSNFWTGIGDCYEYDPGTDSWKTLPSMPTGTARGASAMGVHGSTIYVAGGLTVLNPVTGAQSSTDIVSSYHTKTREWKTLPSLPEGRDHVGGVVVKGVFYVVGGRVNGARNVRNTVYAMNVSRSDRKWVEKAAMPTARGGLSTGAIGSKIFTFGGEGDAALIPNGVYDSVEVYDTLSDSWEALPPMPFPRHGTNAASIGPGIHIPGGSNVTGAGAQARNDFFHPLGMSR